MASIWLVFASPFFVVVVVVVVVESDDVDVWLFKTCHFSNCFFPC